MEAKLDNKFKKLGKTKLIKGSILHPEASGLSMIMTAAPASGKPDDGLYNLLDTKWRNAKAELKGWYQYHVNYKLGNIQDTAVNSDIWIMHCLFVNDKGKVDEKALDECLKKLCQKALYEKATVHVSTLLTKAIPTLEPKIAKSLIENGVSVFYYDEAKKA